MSITRATSRGVARGAVLLAVLLVLVAACLIGSTIAMRTSADVDGARFRLHEAQARAAAWSGVLAAMGELESQRRELLAGAAPKLAGSVVLSRADDPLTVSARLVEGDDGAVVAPQSRCVGVNAAPAEMLKATGVLDEPAAARIAARAAERPFSSVEEALVFARIVPPVASAGAAKDAESPETADRAGAASEPVGPERGATSVLTAYSFDPEVGAGFGDDGHAGEPRVAWATLVESKESAAGLGRLFGGDAAPAIEKLVTSGAKAVSRAELIGALRRVNLDPKYWGLVLDRVRAGDDEFVTGRVDLSSASAAVLACVPGIGPEHGAAIVRGRERLSAEALRSLAWPVTESILTPDEFERAVDRLTTRSAQYRVRVEGTVAPRGSEGASEPARPMARVVYDAIIDVSSEPARVAYLRDATLLGIASEVRGRGVHAPERSSSRPSPEEAPPTISEPSLDVPTPRAQNTRASRTDPAAPSAGSASSPGSSPDRTQGRVGRWSPGPRSRGDGG